MPYTLNNSTVRQSTYILSYDLQLEYCKFLTGQLQSTKKLKDYVRGNSVVEWGNSVALGDIIRKFLIHNYYTK